MKYGKAFHHAKKKKKRKKTTLKRKFFLIPCHFRWAAKIKKCCKKLIIHER